MRERRLGCGKRKAARYTLTYDEGTRAFRNLLQIVAIYPHVWWGNARYFFHNLLKFDIPSRMMREQRTQERTLQSNRYTLTYDEGTKPILLDYRRRLIYPHVWWGNRRARQRPTYTRDIPSRMMRERYVFRMHRVQARYTLTYDEGMLIYSFEFFLKPIHPHI